MPSFDVVSEVNIQEVKNAIDQVHREVTTRYDFKGTNVEVSLNEKDSIIEIVADDDMRLQSVQQVLREKLGKRGVSLKLIEFKDPKKAGGDTLRQEVVVKQGLTSDDLKKINRHLKDKKLKVTSQIQGDQLRVSGKKRDDLQEAIGILRQDMTELELQFINFRD